MDDAASALPLRGQLLQEAIQLTTISRNKTYGDPIHQLGVAGQIKQILRQACRRPMSTAEVEALDLVVTKLSRAFCGSHPGPDTFVDGAAYFAIAGEAFIKQMQAQQATSKPRE